MYINWILNVYASQSVCLAKLLSHLPKNHWILSTHSSTSKNVSWPHFSWPTLYFCYSFKLYIRRQMLCKQELRVHNVQSDLQFYYSLRSLYRIVFWGFFFGHVKNSWCNVLCLLACWFTVQCVYMSQCLSSLFFVWRFARNALNTRTCIVIVRSENPFCVVFTAQCSQIFHTRTTVTNATVRLQAGSPSQLSQLI